MRFVHIADMHLGMLPDKGRSWSDRRAKELWDTFAEVISYCRDTCPELLLVAGDMFHKQPLLKELKSVNQEFASIPSTRVVIIAGNHDYISGNSFYRRFEWSENVRFIASSEVESVYFEDIDTQVYGCSYLNREYREAAFDGLKPEHTDRINILLGHGGDEGNLPIDWKGLARAGFDYVAMGHIHKPQDMAANIRYCGSPEPLDKNETGAHGFIVGEITKAGEVSADKDSVASFAQSPDTTAEDKQKVSDGAGDKVTDIAEFVSDSGKKVVSYRRNCAKRQYIKAELTVAPDDTELTLRQRISALIRERGAANIYCIGLMGERSPDVVFEYDGISDLGLVLELNDKSLPKLDFERLAAQNSDNVIGHFIDSMRVGCADDPIREKALYMGVMALTGRNF